MKKIVITLILVLLIQFSFSQVKKFGKVSVEELNTIKSEEFTEANAEVLFKQEKVYFEHNDDGWIVTTEIHERIKIYNSEGFKSATKIIKFYSEKKNKESVSIRAVTYNIDNSKVIKTKLKNKEIFKKQENRYWSSFTFTMPNIKPGCIVEWKYTKTSPLWKIDDIIFQYDIPIKHFEAKVLIPEYFLYRMKPSKYYSIKINQFNGDNHKMDYKYVTTEALGEKVLHTLNYNYHDVNYEIKKEKIKPLKKEIYISNIENYRGKIRFELVETKLPYTKKRMYSSNWDEVTNSISVFSKFGEELKKSSYFKNDINLLLNNIEDIDERIQTIFEFVKHKVKWNGYYDYYTHDGVKNAYKKGVGNVAEINLMLVAMLREAGVDASPILVSTRSHGIPIFPTREGFNYVIVGIELPEKILLLDATEKYSAINILPKRVLNWKGRMIRKNGTSVFIDLFPKVYSLETNRASIKVENNGSINGNLRLGFKNLKALEYRNSFSSLSDEQLITKLEEILSPIEIEKVRLGNKNDIDKPLMTSLSFKADNQAEIISDKIYFTPLFFLGDTENKFKSEDRKLPIDFASAWKVSDEVQIQIPEGYKIETLPESVSITTENGIGNYEFSISTKDNKIFLKSVTKINMPIIPSNMYKEIKDFYSKRLLKMKEKVVLVKIQN